MATLTDPRVGGTIVECNACGALVVRAVADGACGAYFDLADGTAHSCPTRTSFITFEVVHDPAVDAAVVAQAIRRAVHNEDCANPVEKIEWVA